MNLNGKILFKHIKFLKKESKFWNPVLLSYDTNIPKKRLEIFLEISEEAFFYYSKCNDLELIKIKQKQNIDILSLLNWTLLQSAWLTGRITGNWNNTYYVTQKCNIQNIKDCESIIKSFDFIKDAIENLGKQRTNNIKSIAENLEIRYPENTKILKKITKETLNRKKDNNSQLDWNTAIAYIILISGIFSVPLLTLYISKFNIIEKTIIYILEKDHG